MLKYRVKPIDVDLEDNIVVINEEDAKRSGLTSGSRVFLVDSGKPVPAVVGLSRTLVGPGEVLVPVKVLRSLGLSEGEYLQIKPLALPSSLPYLRKRLVGERLSDTEIMEIVSEIVEGIYDDAGITAFIVSQLVHGLSEAELSALIKAMVETGERVAFEETVYDEHSIGGVPGNSKVALLAVPIVAAAGLLIPKTSSRAITSPSGTADTMEVLANVEFEPEELKEIARKTRGLIAWGGKLNLAPADDIFVRVERKLGIDPHHQMVASILSKKLAMNVSKLVIDIPVGTGAKIETMSEAEHIAALFITQATRLGLTLKVVMTFGGQPIGRTAGPALEAREALQTLMERKGSLSLVEKAFGLAGILLELSGRVPQGKGFEAARSIFESGKAYEKFKEIVEAQGGNPEVKPGDIEVGKYSFTLQSPAEGAVTHVDNMAITMIARAAGAPEDKGAGVYLHVKTGYRVNKGDPILTIYSNSESRLNEAVALAAKYSPIVVEGMLLKLLP